MESTTLKKATPRLRTSKPYRVKVVPTGDPILLKFYQLLTQEDLKFLAACNISLPAEVEA